MIGQATFLELGSEVGCVDVVVEDCTQSLGQVDVAVWMVVQSAKGTRRVKAM